jgi:CHAD domain-containing protein
MKADDRIELALSASVGEHVQKLRKRLAKAEKERDPDSVHDGRTALRRVREALVVMRDSVFDPKRTTKLEDELHDLERSLAKARDTDVLAETLRAYTRKHRGEADGLRDLADLLKTRRKKGAREAKRCLAGRRAVVKDIEKVLAGKDCIVVHPPSDPSKASPTLVRHFTREAIWKQYDAVLAYDARPSPDAETMHAFRSACRRLRYALELFAEALPGAKTVIADLRDIQSRIGDMHDAHMAALLVEKWTRNGKLRATPEIERFVADRTRTRDRLRASLLHRVERILGPRFRAALTQAIEHEAA